MAPVPPRERLLTPRFLLVVAAGLSYFMAVGMLIPVVPQYVKGPLGGGNVGVGVAVGSLFVGAVLLRPYAGRVGDRFGRRVLIIGGALIVAITTAFYGAVDALPYLVMIRLLSGIGEAAFFVGAATMITDLAPEHRRGEAVSYWSVAVYGGLILCVRIIGARLPDALGGRVAATIALSCGAVGLTVMAGWPTVPGLVVGTAVFAAGMSLLYPALMLLALTAVPEHERGSVVGTFSSFFDLSQGLGALILGGVAALSGYRGAFAGGAVAAAAGVVLLQLRIGLTSRGRAGPARPSTEHVPA